MSVCFVLTHQISGFKIITDLERYLKQRPCENSARYTLIKEQLPRLLRCHLRVLA